jgi:hypothetical protein
LTRNDLSALREEITHLRHALADLRLTYANLLAATRAAVAAELDGEPDPIAYLRFELPDHPADRIWSHPDAVPGPGHDVCGGGR